MSPFYRILSMLALLATAALAPLSARAQCVDETAGVTYILDTVDECANIHDGAQIRQGVPVNAGTGNLDPFLRVSKGGNGVVVHGLNGDGTLNYDEDNSWTSALLLSAVSLYFDPETDTIYREFVLDINQSSNPGVYYPINDLRLYKGASATLNGAFVAPGINPVQHPGMTKIWDLDNGTDPDQRAILLDYDFEAGSGKNPDMILRIPDAEFAGSDYCSYGQSGCTTWIYLYTRHGAIGEVTVPPTGYSSLPPLEADNAGFEEWATFVKPFAEVSKTAVASVGEEYEWTIDKTADPDQCSAFAGGDCDVDYHLTVTKTPYNVEITVSGLITIHVPTIFPVTGATIKTPLVVSEVTDLFGGVEYNNAYIDCALGDSFTLQPGATTTCDYEFTLTEAQYATLLFDGPHGFPTNMPTNVALAIGVEVGTGGELIYTPFPSDAETVEENGFYPADGAILSVDVFDTPEGQSTDDLGSVAHGLAGQVEEFFDGIDFTDAIGTFECSEDAGDYVDGGTHYQFDRDNLGEIYDGAAKLDDDDATVTIDCFLPQISKTADGSYDNLWEWEIEKVVSPEVADLFAGQSISPDYVITLTKSGPTQANHLVSGVISITNPSTDLALDLEVSLADVLSDATPGVLGSPCESGELTVLAGQTVDCPYTSEPSDDTAVSNTATATTLDGFEFSDTVGFQWLVTEVNGTVNVSDTNKDGGVEFGASGTWEYSDLEFSCPTAEEEYEDGQWSDSYGNTASIDETGQSDDALFSLNCYAPVVDKTALTELDRTYSWDVAKSIADATEGNDRYAVDGDADALDYDVIAGDLIDSDFTIVVSRDSVDSNWHVWGTITIDNPAGTPPGAMDITVFDVIKLDGEFDAQGVVTCADAVGDANHVIVPAGGSVECEYEAYLTDDSNRTNTATALLEIGIGDGVPFTVTVPVTFYDGDVLVAQVNRFNETASLSDAVVVDGGDPVANGSWEFDWTTALEDLTVMYGDPYECSVDETDYTGGMYSVSRVNTATLVDRDESEFADDASRDVTCYAPDVSKDANEWIVRTYTWDVAKTVADKDGSVANADPNVLTYDVFVNDSDVAAYTITITRDSTDTWFVSGTIDLMNPAGSPADMAVDVSDLIPGQMSMYVSCEGAIDPEAPADGNTSIVLEPGAGQQCFYFAQLPDTDQRLNTATAEFEGNPYTGTADVIFDGDTPIERVNESIDVDDFSSVDDGGEVANADGGPWPFDWTTPEIDLVVGYDVEFACSANPADYVDGTYTSTRANRAVIRGTEIEDDADVTLNCYAPVVDKDATTSYDRQWNWTIAKSAEDQESDQAGAGIYEDAVSELMWINLQGGNQAFLVTYTLVVHAESEEFNEAVSGTITVENPHPSAIMTVDVADLLPDASGMSVVCEGTGTTVLNVDPLGTGTCAYSASLPSATVQRLNTGRVTLNEVDFDATADVIFGVPTNEIDRCVDVEDLAGPLGYEVLNVVATEVCATGPETGPLGDGETFDPDPFTYDVQFGGSDPGGETIWVPLEDCIPYEHPNTASLRGDDDAVVADDQWWIYFNVGCPGCTLTQGYWKTHSELFWGGAPEDPTWNILFTDGETGCDPDEPETCAYDGGKPFFNGSYSWFDVMITPPKGGNPFYQLGHQWIAATLNTLAGAYTPPEVEEALLQGGLLLEKYSADPDALVIKGKGKKSSAAEEIVEDGAMMGSYASTLAAYNEGDIGPGHCDDDGTEQFGVSGLVNVAGSVEAAVELGGTGVPVEDGSSIQAAADKVDDVRVEETSELAGAQAPTTEGTVEATGEAGARRPVDGEGKGDNELARLKAGDESLGEEITEVGSRNGSDAYASRNELPKAFSVGNYPNPFNPVTTIQVALPEASHVRVAVYDLLGRMVRLLVDGQLSAGTHSVTFDAGQLPSGVYLYRFEHSGGAVTRTMQLLK